jgi:ankyrin repeat protein
MKQNSRKIFIYGLMISMMHVYPMRAMYHSLILGIGAAFCGGGALYGGYYYLQRRSVPVLKNVIPVSRVQVLQGGPESLKVLRKPTFKDFADAMYHDEYVRFDSLLKLAQEHGGISKISNERGTTVLMQAAAHGNEQYVQDILKYDRDINMTDNYGKTALIASVYAPSSNVLSLLIQQGAKVNHSDDNGETALMHALKNKKFDSARVLLSYKARPDALSNNEKSPLMLAVEVSCPIEIVQDLIHKDILNARDCSGKTPLMASAERGCGDVLDLLYLRGAHRDVQDHCGKNVIDYALDYAIHNSKPQFLDILQTIGFTIREHGHCNLVRHIQVMKKYDDTMQDNLRSREYYNAQTCIKWLIARGAHPDKPYTLNPYAKTPCQEAAARRDILQALGKQQLPQVRSRL